MNSSHYVDANHVTQSCNLTHLIYGEGNPLLPQQHNHYPPTIHHPPHKLSLTITNLSMSQYEAYRAATLIMRCLGNLSHTEMMQERERKEERKQITVAMCGGGMTMSRWPTVDVWVYTILAYYIYTHTHCMLYVHRLSVWIKSQSFHPEDGSMTFAEGNYAIKWSQLRIYFGVF